MKIFARLLIAIIALCINNLSADAQSALPALKWQLAAQSDVKEQPLQVSMPGFNLPNAVNAIVPGTVFYSYVKAGKEQDPDYAENIYKVDAAKYNKPFWYRTEFVTPTLSNDKRIWLNFDGINKRGKVYLNGKHIGTVNGLADKRKYDITGILNKGKTNALAVLVFTPNTTHGLANREAPTYLSSGSWDWMPAVPGLNSGLTDKVYLTTSGPVTIDAPWVKVDLPNKDLAELNVNVALNNASDQAVTGRVKFVINPGNIVVTGPVITLKANSEQSVKYTKADFAQLAIKNPKLWWPNGYGGKADGTQHLYNCSASFVVGNADSETVSKVFGIRKVTSDTTAVNGPLRLYVNDVPILLKGGNWGMSDYMLKVRENDYDARIKFHREMNFNMIRNWTGEVTDEAFYDYCDKYGIMVWDDFWLNNFGPIDSLGVFKINAIAKVKKLRNHPSITVWCGANEGLPQGSPTSPLSLVIKDAIRENDGDDKLYIDRSNAGPTNPNFSIHGGSKMLSGSGNWSNTDPKTYFTDPKNGYLFSKDSYGLRSELGAAAFVNIESFKKFMPKENWVAPTQKDVESKTNMWARHYFSTDGALGGGSEPVKYINFINKSYGAATSIEDFCKKAQLQNVETTKAMFEAWNDHMWKDATGLLMWMSQSAYPSMIWQTYDYYYDLTGAYFGAKTACEPVHIQWNAANNSVKVINNKAYAIKGLTAEAVVYNTDGKPAAGYSQSKKLDVTPSSATEAFVAFEGKGDRSNLSDVHFLKLKLKDAVGKTISENFYWMGKNYLDYTALNKLPSVGKDLSVSAPRVTVAIDGASKVLNYVISNRSNKTAAFGIRAQLLDNKGEQILPAFISDSYFSLMQGEVKTVTVEVDAKMLIKGYKLDVKAYNE
ncbi:glycoside hydrolase family 2 protein [Mucilaginibacter myungsuensis]|uniref:Beta galactosidase jelly roll domain-containing protein n=1 Tax=Mucilaginibacter myungsuensis TaxID=649104 RepID=A0A929KU87_9SPHI|nr:sugar-binding domain-containing protein [Mucilaginibacter myungsuensis]MBE9660887.1 beta galactosidase jelly roll domain-containing protein [Mucilaginibacter myungsuensis]MDN3600934.1 beta galactosidase jelly roll domain-containing protein [Mucilaginibacter myungsuensis]